MQTFKVLSVLFLSSTLAFSQTGDSSLDGDGDGLRDDWELSYFGDLSQDGAGDPDQDGMTNLEEYREFTNPVMANDLPGNVIKNGLLENDLGTNDYNHNGAPMDSTPDGVPDHWTPNISGAASYVLSGGIQTVGARNSRMLMTSFSGTAAEASSSMSFWRQEPIPLEPNTWYEFRAAAAFDGVEPHMTSKSIRVVRDDIMETVSVPVIDSGSALISLSLTVHGGDGMMLREMPVFVSSEGPEMIDPPGSDPFDLDTGSWVHADVARSPQPRGLQNWRTVKRYFRTPSEAVYASAMTIHHAKGAGYFDNLALRKVRGNLDPTDRSLNESGTLPLISYQGSPFFPIMLYGFPKGLIQSASDLEWVKNAGFNTGSPLNYPGNRGQAMQAFADHDLAMIPSLMGAYHLSTDPNGAGNSVWIPPSALPAPAVYVGADITRSLVESYVGYSHLLAIGSTMDEIDGTPHHAGQWLPNLAPANVYQAYVRREMPDVPLYTNFSNGFTAYTGSVEDKVTRYLPTCDIATLTQNLPIATSTYINVQGQILEGYRAVPLLPRVGEQLRKHIHIGRRSTPSVQTKLMAFALGTNCWARWDGYLQLSSLDPDVRAFHCDKYIPFHLQRFLIWDQIINGAVGVMFAGGYTLDLRPHSPPAVVNPQQPYYEHFWEQLKFLGRELAGLEEVLRGSDYSGDWSATHPDINIMVKPSSSGRMYVFAANRSVSTVSNVTIRLRGKIMHSVAALNEAPQSGALCLAADDPGCRRSVPVNADASTFTDSFEYQDPRDLIPLYPDEYPTPDDFPELNGYAVHLYEVEASDAPPAPAATLVAARTRKTHSGRGMQDIPLSVTGPWTSEPRQDGITRIRLAFNAAPGTPIAESIVITERRCRDPDFGPYIGSAVMSTFITGNDLVLSFSPPLENARTYRFSFGPEITSIAGQSITVRALQGDINSDGRVDTTDRSTVVGVWTGGGADPYSIPTDINRDGVTSWVDRSLVIGAWSNPQLNCAP